MHAFAFHPTLVLPTLWIRWLLPLLALTLVGAVRAQQAPMATDVLAVASQTQAEIQAPALRLEMSTVSAPTLDEGAASHLTLTGWSGSSRRAGSDAGIGVGMGLTTPDARTAEQRALGGTAGPAQPRLDLGLNWRSADEGRGRFNVGVWQRVSPAPDAMTMIQQSQTQANYDTRVEMQFSTASSRGVRFEMGGALGMQLNNGGDKVVLRLKHGRPMVYYRARF